MATNNKTKQIKITSPRGILKYPRLNEPDGKFDPERPAYRTSLILNGRNENVKAFLAKLDELMEQAKSQAAADFKELKIETRKKIGEIIPNPAYSQVYDEETEEPTGEIEVRFTRRAAGKRKDGTHWTAPRPPLFDSAKPPKLISRNLEIWGGTVAAINFTINPYFMPATGKYGITLRIEAVQIFELVTKGGARSADYYGFEGADDGWSADDLVEAEDAQDNPTDISEASVDDEADF